MNHAENHPMSSSNRTVNFVGLGHGLSFTILFAAVFIAALYVGAAPASASQSVFDFFGSTGSEGGQFGTANEGVGGIAVNDETGDIYVVDRGNNRIEEFDPEQNFIRTWGVDVIESGKPNDNGTGFEICDTTAGDTAADCKAGEASGIAGGMNDPQGIAINQTTGDVYVTDGKNLRVDEFDSTGHFIRAWGQNVVASGPDNHDAQTSIQELTVTATGGKFTLEDRGATTGELPFDATAAEVKASLIALGVLGSSVQVTGGPGTYSITFGFQQANYPVPTIVAASGSAEPLSGGTASVTSIQEGATGFEICDVKANPTDLCQTGVGNAEGNGTFDSPFTSYLAIAPAGAPNEGDVFVGDPSIDRFEQFSAGGQFIAAVGGTVLKFSPHASTNGNICIEADEDICGQAFGRTSGVGFEADSPTRLAVKPSGAVLATSSKQTRLEEYSPDLTVEQDFLTSECSTPGLGGTSENCQEVMVDQGSGQVYVSKGVPGTEEICIPGFGCITASHLKEFALVRASADGSEVLETSLEGSEVKPLNALAIDASVGKERSGRVYLTTTAPEQRVDVVGEPTPPTVQIAPIEAADVGQRSAKVSGTINPEGDKIHTQYRFEYITHGTSWRSAPEPAEDIGNGTEPVAVSQTLTGLQPNATYRVRLVALKGGTYRSPEVKFTTSVASPGVETGEAHWSSPASTEPSLTFEGQVNPDNLETTYYFEYGPDRSYGHRVPAGINESISTSGAFELARQTVDSLDPAVTYHYRLVAVNTSGTARGDDHEVAPPRPDQRFPELVSPPDKRPIGYVGPLLARNYRVAAAGDGNGLYYIINNGLKDTTAGGEISYVADRGATEWHSTQVTPPALVPSLGSGSAVGNIPYVADNLSCTIAGTVQPLTADTPRVDTENGVINLYRRAADGTYSLLSSRIPANPTLSEINYFGIGGVSPDCDQVVFETPYRLLPEAPANGEGLYEWNNGTLEYAGILPDGSVATDAEAGGYTSGHGNSFLNTVSRDGKRLFFSANSDSGGDSGQQAIFVREGGVSKDISQSQTATPNDSESAYQMAAADGSRVFFMARYGLAAQSSSGATSCAAGSGAGCDLYEYDLDNSELSDLSADSNAADTVGAAVKGVLGASDDGSYVYFAARGQLVPGEGNTYAQNTASGARAFNVYLSHEGQLSFVGLLAEGDTGNGVDSAVVYQPAEWSSRVTPDGKYLLFVSTANVTGYESGGAKEAYVYSAAGNETICVSCRPDGEPSAMAANEQVVPTQQKLGTPEYPRTLSDDGGRVFFESKDALALGAVEGETNLYEWEAGDGAGGGSVHLLGDEMQFQDASADGDDVFVYTKRRLVPEDFDVAADAYDLRIGGGYPYTPPPEACDVAASRCQGPPTAGPTSAAPGSSTFAGPGNPKAKRNGRRCVAVARKAGKLRRGAKALRHRAARANAGKARRLHRRATAAAKRARRLSTKARRCRAGGKTKPKAKQHSARRAGHDRRAH